MHAMLWTGEGEKSNATSVNRPIVVDIRTPGADGSTAYDHHEVVNEVGNTTTALAEVEGRKVTRRPTIGRGGYT